MASTTQSGKLVWWAVTGSNRRPTRCKRAALPAELTARSFLYNRIFYIAENRTMYPKTEPAAQRQPVHTQVRKNRCLVVNRVLEPFTCFELRLLGSRDLDRFTSPRITAGRGLPISNAESTETNQSNFSATFERPGDRIEHRVYSFRRISFGEVRTVGHGSHEIILVHDTPFQFMKPYLIAVLRQTPGHGISPGARSKFKGGFWDASIEKTAVFRHFPVF